MTIELGAAKCLVILGISQEKLTRIIKEEERKSYPDCHPQN